MFIRYFSLFILTIFAAEPSAAEETRFSQGRLWRVETAGTAPSWVVGTMHSAAPEIATPWPALARVMERVDSITVEMILDQAATAAMGRAMVLDEGRSLGEIAGPQRMARIADAAQKYGMPPAALEHFRPWAVTMIFSVPPSELQRQAQGKPMLDNVLREYGEERGIPVYGIESVEEQIAVFADYNEEEQLALLDVTMEMQPQMEPQFADLRRAWLAGDLASLYRTAMEMPDMGAIEIVEDFTTRLIAERNHRMAERIQPRLKEGNALIAVGALHLPGEEGLLALLEEEGYRVTRVEQ
jgi:uncharacterized protein YbaP (TraB family)